MSDVKIEWVQLSDEEAASGKFDHLKEWTQYQRRNGKMISTYGKPFFGVRKDVYDHITRGAEICPDVEKRAEEYFNGETSIFK